MQLFSKAIPHSLWLVRQSIPLFRLPSSRFGSWETRAMRFRLCEEFGFGLGWGWKKRRLPGKSPHMKKEQSRAVVTLQHCRLNSLGWPQTSGVWERNSQDCILHCVDKQRFQIPWTTFLWFRSNRSWFLSEITFHNGDRWRPGTVSGISLIFRKPRMSRSAPFQFKNQLSSDPADWNPKCGIAFSEF
jgi:hypothetical protein